MSDKQSSQPVIDQASQQKIGKLNLRIADMMDELNATIKHLLDEKARLEAEVQKLKGQVVQAANKDVAGPKVAKS
jgi:uncharacterized small protein (DUF1192 family)